MGADLFSSFVYVRQMDSDGPASMGGVEMGDQVCELQGVIIEDYAEV